MVVGAAADGAEILGMRLGDWHVIDTCDTPAHETTVGKFPILIPVGTELISLFIVPFIGKPHGDACSVECPQFLDEIIKLLVPRVKNRTMTSRPVINSERFCHTLSTV